MRISDWSSDVCSSDLMRWPKPCWSHRLEEWRHHSAPVAGFAEQPHQLAKHVLHRPLALGRQLEAEHPLILQMAVPDREAARGQLLDIAKPGRLWHIGEIGRAHV